MGAVAANLRVRNSRASWLTRLQECEYALQHHPLAAVALARRLPVDLARGRRLFRAEILKDLGGFDTGLGDDNGHDAESCASRGWRLGFALDEWCGPDVPVTPGALLRQRTRWERNMVKIRLRKHGDLAFYNRFGLRNALLRSTCCWSHRPAGDRHRRPGDDRRQRPGRDRVRRAYVLAERRRRADQADDRARHRLDAAARAAGDGAGAAVYRVVLRAFLLLAVAREALRLGQRHAYVPLHIWRETPHW